MYMCPEMITSSSIGHGFEADWWSLGVLIYEMLLGEPPFKGDNEQQVRQNIMQKKLKVILLSLFLSFLFFFFKIEICQSNAFSKKKKPLIHL